MSTSAEATSDRAAPAMVEGIARVVAMDGNLAWLEPEQTTSCGDCASSASCGAKGIGTLASRLEARRFPLRETGLAVGERVVVGVREDALVKAALTAYAIPLGVALAAGAMAQWTAGSDVITLAATIAGLALGLGVAHLGADRLLARGQISPQVLRRAGTDRCGLD